MKNYISTWIYLDSKEEKSHFPQIGGDSSEEEFQKIYWRCILVFYETSIRNNKDNQHILFTNTNTLPIVDEINFKDYFKKNNIEVVVLENLYPLPKNYYGSFGNQFFEFSIIDHLSKIMAPKDRILILDSDCIFTKPINPIYDILDTNIAATYVYEYEEDHKINGLTRKEMKVLFNELGYEVDSSPLYSAGEILLASGKFIKNVAQDFPNLFQDLLQRNNNGNLKFNEEAHVLSYYYYKHDASLGTLNNFIKRLWTDKTKFRNVEKKDENLAIWHLPAEKTTGIRDIYNQITQGLDLKELDDNHYQKMMTNYLLKSKGKIYKIKRKIKNILNSI